MRFHDMLFPKKHKTTNSKPDINKEYSVDEIAQLIKTRDDADLKLRVARLTPDERLRLRHKTIDRRNQRRR